MWITDLPNDFTDGGFSIMDKSYQETKQRGRKLREIYGKFPLISPSNQLEDSEQKAMNYREQSHHGVLLKRRPSP